MKCGFGLSHLMWGSLCASHPSYTYTTLYTLYIVASSNHVAMHWALGVCSRELFANSIVDATTSTDVQYSVLHDNVRVHTYYYIM